MYVCMYTCYLHIYYASERERDQELHICTYVCVYIIYIYIYATTYIYRYTDISFVFYIDVRKDVSSFP